MNPDSIDHSAWMDAFFASYYEHRPVNATFVGMHDFDGRLPDFSENGAGDVLADTQDILRRSDPPPGSLTTAASLDRKLARGFLGVRRSSA